MRYIFWVAACGLLFTGPSIHGQKPSNTVEWGPWRYTDFKVSGIEFRSKCVSSANANSKWAYQFRSRFTGPMDFRARTERGLSESPGNEFENLNRSTLDAHEIGPVYETDIHGTCTEVKELKIEVVCVTEHDLTNPCYDDSDGPQSEAKPVPDSPNWEVAIRGDRHG